MLLFAARFWNLNRYASTDAYSPPGAPGAASVPLRAPDMCTMIVVLPMYDTDAPDATVSDRSTGCTSVSNEFTLIGRNCEPVESWCRSGTFGSSGSTSASDDELMLDV